jgi:hypothetical protein
MYILTADLLLQTATDKSQIRFLIRDDARQGQNITVKQ